MCAPLRVLVLGPVVAVLLTSCAQPDGDPVVTPGAPGTTEPTPASEPTNEPTPTTEPTSPVPAVNADVTITVDDGAGSVTTYRLTCEPAAGDHPHPAAACRALAATWPSVFEPVPADRSCTMQYGGPQTATVKGTIAGQPVDASFALTNGCEISRWQAVEPLLGPAGNPDS